MSRLPVLKAHQNAAKFNGNRRNLLVDDAVLDDETRKKILEDIQAGQGAAKKKLTAPAGPSITAPPPVPATSQQDDPDLLSVMCQRLKQLESHVSVQQKELKLKSLKVIELEDALRIEREDRRQAQRERDRFARQVDEMHAFLADYGMAWKGESSADEDSANEAPAAEPSQKDKCCGATGPCDDQRGRAPAKSDEEGKKPPALDIYAGNFNPVPPTEVGGPPPGRSSSFVTASAVASSGGEVATTKQPPALPFSLQRLVSNAESLSASVGNTMVLSEAQRAVIKERDVVTVCVYANGICVNSGPFRPYGWPLCDAFLHDLLDGFYPYEFKDRYPSGFPIKVIDKSCDMCPVGPGGRNTGNIVSVNDDRGGYKQLSREELLQKLPSSYITASGHLINVKDEVKGFLGGGPARECKSTALEGTIAPKTAAARALDEDPERKDSTTSIMCRLPTGAKVLLRMFRTDTVAEVRRQLVDAAADYLHGKEFEISTILPRRLLADVTETLDAAGLFPSSTVAVRIVLPPSS